MGAQNQSESAVAISAYMISQVTERENWQLKKLELTKINISGLQANRIHFAILQFKNLSETYMKKNISNTIQICVNKF